MEYWVEVATFEEGDFLSCRPIFLFFRQYLDEYGGLPSNSQIATRFTWSPPVGDFVYWFKEMKRYVEARKVLEAIKEAHDGIGNPAKATDTLIQKLSLLRSKNNNHIQAYDSTGQDRLDMFDYRTENIMKANKLVGVPTGLKILDDTHVGYIPGSLVGCYSRPNVGKTWWLMWSGVNCWEAGGTVLSISPEMPANMLNLRIDVLVAQRLGMEIEYNKLLIGDPIIRPNYERVTQILNNSGRWWNYDSIDDKTIGVPDLAALIRQHKPDILLIDGVMLLRPERRSAQVWEQMHDNMYGLKNLATIHEIPILVTSHAVNSARGRRTEVQITGRGDDFIMPSLNDAAGGDDFVRACSDVITMCGEPTSQYINWYSLRKYRERGWQGGIPPRMALAVDFAVGKIYDLSPLGFQPEKVGDETRRLIGRL